MLCRALVVAAALVAFAPHSARGRSTVGRAGGRRPLRGQRAGRVRHQGGAERSLEGSRLPLGEGRQIDPTYAAAWNNLAVAFEQQGNFDKAREAYEKAVELDPKNLLFRQNYDLFKEINDRTKRRRDR